MGNPVARFQLDYRVRTADPTGRWPGQLLRVTLPFVISASPITPNGNMTNPTDPDMPNASSAKRSPWMAIGLGLLLTLVVSLAVLWPGNWQSAEQTAIEELTADGGAVTYDWESGPQSSPQLTPPGHLAGRLWLGENYAAHAAHINSKDRSAETLTSALIHLPKLQWIELVACDFDSDVAQALVSRPELTVISFTRMSPSAESLEALSLGSQIEELVFLNTPVTSEQLTAISKFANLKTLYLTESNGTDADLKQLARLTSLENLIIYHMPEITDDGVSHLKTLTQLKDFALPRSQITARSLSIVTHMPQLESITMSCRPTEEDATLLTNQLWPQVPKLKYVELDAQCIDDDDLTKIAHLPKLETLSLYNPSITDSGVAQLAQAKQLQTLTLYGTHITSQGLKPLAQLPELFLVIVSSDQAIDIDKVGTVDVYHELFDPQGPRPQLPTPYEVD